MQSIFNDIWSAYLNINLHTQCETLAEKQKVLKNNIIHWWNEWWLKPIGIVFLIAIIWKMFEDSLSLSFSLSIGSWETCLFLINETTILFFVQEAPFPRLIQNNMELYWIYNSFLSYSKKNVFNQKYMSIIIN